jgi:hypothetical protein
MREIWGKLEKFHEDMRKTWRIMMKRWKKNRLDHISSDFTKKIMGLCEKICQDKNGKRFRKCEFLIFNA